MDSPGGQDIFFERERVLDLVSWDADSNLLAVQLASAPYPAPLRVCILEPRCPQDHAILEVPTAHAGEALTHLLWLPGPGPKTLLTLSSRGAAHSWSQVDPDAELAAAVCLDVWYGAPAFQLPPGGGRVLAFSALAPPSPWDIGEGPPHSTREGRHFNKVGDLLDFWQRHGLERAFCRPQSAPALPLLRPGLSAVAAVSEDGLLHLWEDTAGLRRQGCSRWAVAAPLRLGAGGADAATDAATDAGNPSPQPPLRAAALATDGAAVLAALVDADGRAHVMADPGPLARLAGGAGSPHPAPPATSHTFGLAEGVAAERVAFLSDAALLCVGRRAADPGACHLAVLQRGADGGWARRAARDVPLAPDDPTPAPALSADGSLVLLSLSSSAPRPLVLRADSLADARGLGPGCAADAWPGTGPAASRPPPTSPPTLAVSPNGCYAASASPGGVTLRLLPLFRFPTPESGMPLAVELAKRAALCALRSGATWDLERAGAALAAACGPSPLSVYLSLVDAAVLATRAALRAPAAAAWARLKAAALAPAPDALADALRADLGLQLWTGHVTAVQESLRSALAAPVEDSGGAAARGGDAGREASHRQLQAGFIVQYWSCWVADAATYVLRCAALWARRRSAAPDAPLHGGTKAVAELGARAGAGGPWPLGWAALVEAHPDCVPGMRCLADTHFIKRLSTCLSTAVAYARQMQKMVDGGRSNHSEFLVKSMARLNVIYKPMASILRAIAEDAKQREAAGGEGGAPPQDPASPEVVAAAVAGMGGPWRLHYPGAAAGMGWRRLEAALAGSGEVLARWRNDTPASLLAEARALGVLGAAPAPDATLEHRERRRQAAAALEASLPPLAGWDTGWGSGGVATARVGGEASELEEPWWGTEAAERVDRCQVLVDALSGARLDWARQQSFASADGCVVTAELQPAALALGSPMAWQACWAVACPVNGQAWKSLAPKQQQ